MPFLHRFAHQKQKKVLFFIAALALLAVMTAIVYKSGVKKPDIWVGFVGTSKDDPDVVTLHRALALKKVHGIILFGRNIVSPDQVRSLVSFLTQNNRHIPVAIDQEGGTVRRLEENKGFVACGAMPAAADYQGNALDISTIHEAAAKEMKDVGITVVFGPVADTNINPHCPVIGARDRSFSDQPNQVIHCCNAVIAAYEKYGLMACLKHVPGHGSSVVDSHKGLTDVTSTWSKQELEPFVQCFKAHPKTAMMMSHVILRTQDPQFPASMSKKIVDFLHNQLRQSGVSQKPLLISDAYDMKAICDFYTPRQFLNQCGAAGLDVVLFYCANEFTAKYPSLSDFLKKELDIVV
jgi:beta-N-acetylhexosaminidase